jgi:hypothetical protein
VPWAEVGVRTVGGEAREGLSPQIGDLKEWRPESWGFLKVFVASSGEGGLKASVAEWVRDALMTSQRARERVRSGRAFCCPSRGPGLNSHRPGSFPVLSS